MLGQKSGLSLGQGLQFGGLGQQQGASVAEVWVPLLIVPRALYRPARKWRRDKPGPGSAATG